MKIRSAGLVLAVITAAAFSMRCGDDSPKASDQSQSDREKVPSRVCDTLSKDDLFYSYLSSGDTALISIYARGYEVAADEPVIVGRGFRVDGGKILLRWRRVKPWEGADTLWAWTRVKVGRSGQTSGLGLSKFLLSDPDYGLQVSTGGSVPSPRLGESWQRIALPFAPLGSSVDLMKSGR